MLSSSHLSRFCCIVSRSKNNNNAGGIKVFRNNCYPHYFVLPGQIISNSIKCFSSFLKRQQQHQQSILVRENSHNVLIFTNISRMSPYQSHQPQLHSSCQQYSTKSLDKKLSKEYIKQTGFDMVTNPSVPGGITRINRKWLTKKKKPKATAPTSIFTSSKELRPEVYQNLLERFPQVAELDESSVRKVISEGSVYGFGPSTVCKMLCRFPTLLDFYEEWFPNSMKAWRPIGFTERERMLMFMKNPQLMGIPSKIVAKGYGFLSVYFSQKELTTLIKNNPRCIIESELALKRKLDTLWKNYSHSTLAIAQSEAMSRDMSQITIRHEFLIRAGLLKVMSHHKFLKHQSEEDMRLITKTRDRYFTPNDIVCSSDEKFLTVCTKNSLSLGELNSFGEILHWEQESQRLDEESDDDEEEVQALDENKSMTSKSILSHNQKNNEANENHGDCDDIQTNSTRFQVRNSYGFFSVIDVVDFYY